eukprot:365377-Chlamydomonas_euryale.AAC.17
MAAGRAAVVLVLCAVLLVCACFATPRWSQRIVVAAAACADAAPPAVPRCTNLMHIITAGCANGASMPAEGLSTRSWSCAAGGRA